MDIKSTTIKVLGRISQTSMKKSEIVVYLHTFGLNLYEAEANSAFVLNDAVESGWLLKTGNLFSITAKGKDYLKGQQ